MKEHILSLCLLTLFTYGRMFSSNGTDGNQKPVRSAVRQYAKERILPVLTQKRQELEKELTPAEKSEIAECRAGLRRIREQHREFMQQKPEGVSLRDYMEENQKNAPDLHKQMRTVMERLQTIADKHSNTLDKFKADLVPAVKQWKEDIARLLPQNNQNNDAWHGGYYQHGMEGNFLHGLNGEHAQAFFLLLSTNTSENETELNTFDNELKSEAAGTTVINSTPATGSFRISPNPASNEIVTGSDLLPASNELFIYDMQGKLVAKLQNVQASQHIDITNLANGAYLVQLKSDGREENTKVVISH